VKRKQEDLVEKGVSLVVEFREKVDALDVHIESTRR